MKDFADEIIAEILKNEMPRLDKIMNEVTRNIRDDFAQETYKLLDMYYDDYTPIRYVRLYGPKRKLRTKNGKTTRKPRAGGVSLHAAIMRQGADGPAIGVSGGNFNDGYVGGVVFDEGYFQGNGMRHLGKGTGFREWNIVENFLFAGEGGYGDWRAYDSTYGGTSADSELNNFMNNYDKILDMHYQNALKKF